MSTYPIRNVVAQRLRSRFVAKTSGVRIPSLNFICSFTLSFFQYVNRAKRVKGHLEHQLQHENDACKCSDLKPLHVFVSGIGGTGKFLLIKTVCTLVGEIWHDQNDSLLCAVSAPMGLAAFNVGGVTIHRLLQLPIEHEGRAAGYWRLGKDTLYTR